MRNYIALFYMGILTDQCSNPNADLDVFVRKKIPDVIIKKCAFDAVWYVRLKPICHTQCSPTIMFSSGWYLDIFLNKWIGDVISYW